MPAPAAPLAQRVPEEYPQQPHGSPRLPLHPCGTLSRLRGCLTFASASLLASAAEAQGGAGVLGAGAAGVLGAGAAGAAGAGLEHQVELESVAVVLCSGSGCPAK